jgi:glycosyltransferase involved in cell wall biosynthesis
MPYFSIIIPVYNVAPYLRECLDSVLAQTFTDWEAICVDDGSTDESGLILDEYAQKDKRFKVIHQENKGVNFVRQRALDNSTGRWIASIDSDDWVEENFLKRFFDATDKFDCDMVWSDYYIVKNGKKVYEKQDCLPDAEKLQEAFLKGALWGANWNKIYSRNFILKHNVSYPISERVYSSEDLCFNIAFLSYCPKVKYVQNAYYYYRVRKGSIIRSGFSVKRLMSGIYINSFLLQNALTDEILKFVELHKIELKTQSYSSPDIPNKVFKDLYPEILSIKGSPLPLCHKVLFWLSCRGFRTPILSLIKLVRFIRKTKEG